MMPLKKDLIPKIDLTQLMAKKPTAQEFFEKGLTAHQKNDRDAALKFYDQALELNSNHFDSNHMKGVLFMELNKSDLGIPFIKKALDIRDNVAAVHNNYGNCLSQYNKDYKTAIQHFTRAIELDPNYAAPYNNRGNTYGELNQDDLAAEDYKKALELEPNFAEAYNNLGTVYGRMYRYKEAFELYEKAVLLQPIYPVAYNNMGHEYGLLKVYDKSLYFYQKALDQNPPEYIVAQIRFNRSMYYLLLADFETGWEEYEFRWQYNLKSMWRNYEKPVWNGEPLEGKTILIWWEQGFGDCINFSRYCTLLARRGAKVFFEVRPQMYELMKEIEGVTLLKSGVDAIPEFDYHCPLMSLPKKFKTNLSNIPEWTYIKARPSKIEEWKARLGPKTKMRVGLVWSGSKENVNDDKRSIPLSKILSVLPKEVEYISLQKEVREKDLESVKSIQHFELEDFIDTAALIHLCDLVISVDTSTAHLAGAMGKPVWVFLPFRPDWRWLLDRTDTPWYKSMKLYRQNDPDINNLETFRANDWDPVLNKIGLDLKSLLEVKND